MKLHKCTNKQQQTIGYMFWCPGCESYHVFYTANHKLLWKFNGNLELPTFSPSLLIYPSENIPRCHLFLRDGKIEYLSDCSHKLAGQTIDLPDDPND